ncbi:hypothetical protein V6Z79_010284 [Aspergillus fumigatus]
MNHSPELRATENKRQIASFPVYSVSLWICCRRGQSSSTSLSSASQRSVRFIEPTSFPSRLGL